MNRDEVKAHAKATKWQQLYTNKYTDVYTSFPTTTMNETKFLYAGFLPGQLDEHNVERLDPQDTYLIIPHQALILGLEGMEPNASACTRWWLDGNTGTEDDWFDSLNEQDKDVYR